MIPVNIVEGTVNKTSKGSSLTIFAAIYLSLYMGIMKGSRGSLSMSSTGVPRSEPITNRIKNPLFCPKSNSSAVRRHCHPNQQYCDFLIFVTFPYFRTSTSLVPQRKPPNSYLDDTVPRAAAAS